VKGLERKEEEGKATIVGVEQIADNFMPSIILNLKVVIIQRHKRLRAV